MAGGISRRPDAGVAGAGDVGATWKPGVGTENSGPLTEAVGARQLAGGEREQEMAFFFSSLTYLF